MFSVVGTFNRQKKTCILDTIFLMTFSGQIKRRDVCYVIPGQRKTSLKSNLSLMDKDQRTRNHIFCQFTESESDHRISDDVRSCTADASRRTVVVESTVIVLRTLFSEMRRVRYIIIKWNGVFGAQK